MAKIALFPGSFDPITNGHYDVINRASTIFDEIVIGIGQNSAKKYMFSLEQRKAWIKEIFKTNPKIKIKIYEGLTVDFCNKINAKYIIRGLRSSPDFEYERNIAQLNFALQGIETVFFISKPEMSPISSSIVREIIRHGGDVSNFVPFDLN